MKNFLSNQWQKANAAKRGGGQLVLSLDHEDAEALYLQEPTTSNLTAEDIFERRWALTILDKVIQRLREEMEAEGKGDVFDALKERLTGGGDEAPYSEVGAQLGISEGAARATAHRLKARYREILKMEIHQTVSSPEEVDEEIRYLISALGRKK